MARVNNFDGGLSLRIDPSLIKINESQRLLNVDPNPVVLRSGKAFTSSNVSILNSSYNFRGSWITSANIRDYVEYENRLYFTEKGLGAKVVATDEYKLGIDRPSSKLAVDSSGSPITDKNGVQIAGIVVKKPDLDHNSIPSTLKQTAFGNLAVGETKYRITLVSNGVNVHSVDESIVTSGSNISVSLAFPRSFGTIIRVYREYQGKYRLISELSLTVATEVIDKVLDISAKTEYTAVSLTTQGTVQYTETFYNNILDFESAPSAYSAEYNVKKGELVKLSNLATTTDTQVTHRRIYRLGGNLESMVMVAELAIAETEYLDYTSDTKATNILSTQKNYPPETSMHSLTEAYGIFFGLVGSELRFSEIDKPNAWSPENSLKLRHDGTGLLAVPQGLLIFTSTMTYFLTGTDKTKFSLSLVSEKQGCLTNKSCQFVKNAPLWVSHDGICTFETGYVSVISKPLLGKTTFDVAQSVVYDEQYFMLKTDGTLLVFDMRSGFRFYNLDYGSSVHGLVVHNGQLYFASGGKLCTAFTGDDLRFKYTSPVFIGNSHADAKMYQLARIRANGTFDVKFYIDGELALTKTLSGNKVFDLKPPTVSQRGYACHFEIEGVGVVYTLNVEA
jgi:hypothetical protein